MSSHDIVQKSKRKKTDTHNLRTVEKSKAQTGYLALTDYPSGISSNFSKYIILTYPLA